MEQKIKKMDEDELLSLAITIDRFTLWVKTADKKELEKLRKQFEELTGQPADSLYTKLLMAFYAGFESALNVINKLETRARQDGGSDGHGGGE